MHDLTNIRKSFDELVLSRLSDEVLKRNCIDENEELITEELLNRREIIEVPFGSIIYFLAIEDEKLVLYVEIASRMGSDDLYIIKDESYECYDIQGAYGYNGILTSSDDPAFITAFHEAFDAFCLDRRIVAEFTRFHPVLNNQLLASPKMRMYFSRNTVKLDLSQTLEDISQHSFSPKNRNVIKKAEKEGRDTKTIILSGGGGGSGSGAIMAENARLLKSFYPAPGTVSFGGRVSVSARIGVDGRVKSTKIKITSGRPLVDAVAMSAARHWVYKPATDRHGKPMECDAIIIIPFERLKE